MRDTRTDHVADERVCVHVRQCATALEPRQKCKLRESTEIVVGAVVGPVTAPTAFVPGLYDRDGMLRMVGRSTTLSRAQSRALAAVLTAAGVDHPWPDSMAANRFGGARDRVALTRVEPTVVVEVAADAAREYGVWRHGLRSIRLRAELRPEDLPTLPDTAADAPWGSGCAGLTFQS